MSLINDALHRAKNASGQKPPLQRILPDFHPIESYKPSMRFHRLVGLLAGLTVIFSTWLVWRGNRAPHASTVNRAETVTAATKPPVPSLDPSDGVRPNSSGPARTPTAQKPPLAAPKAVNSNAIKPAHVPNTRVAPSAAQIPPPIQRRAGTAKPSAESASVPSQRPPIVLPPLVPVPGENSKEASFELQQIFYRLRRPTAVINGRTLAVGDEIEGWRLQRISRHSVQLSSGTATKELAINRIGNDQ
jgi:hypothetical protein